MTLDISQTERILLNHYGEPVKKPTKYVIGFRSKSNKVLALHRDAAAPRIWFQPPEPPNIDGVELLPNTSNGNSNINGPLEVLRHPDTLRIEIANADGLQLFLGWYDEINPRANDLPTPTNFRVSFNHFQHLVKWKSGDAFTRFNEGLIAVWERYKP